MGESIKAKKPSIIKRRKDSKELQPGRERQGTCTGHNGQSAAVDEGEYFSAEEELDAIAVGDEQAASVDVLRTAQGTTRSLGGEPSGGTRHASRAMPAEGHMLRVGGITDGAGQHTPLGGEQALRGVVMADFHARIGPAARNRIAHNASKGRHQRGDDIQLLSELQSGLDLIPQHAAQMGALLDGKSSEWAPLVSAVATPTETWATVGSGSSIHLPRRATALAAIQGGIVGHTKRAIAAPTGEPSYTAGASTGEIYVKGSTNCNVSLGEQMVDLTDRPNPNGLASMGQFLHGNGFGMYKEPGV